MRDSNALKVAFRDFSPSRSLFADSLDDPLEEVRDVLPQ
jgi:hypothetical protein